MGFEKQDVERKVLAILKVLSSTPDAMGSRVIAERLKGLGIELSERGVRYHLRLMDERGLTQLVGRDGRLITPAGLQEVKDALVQDKVGMAISRIEALSFRTNFDLNTYTGEIPANVSYIPKKDFSKALKAMRPVFDAELCVSNLVTTAEEGETLGGIIVPKGKVGFVTVCSIIINGSLLKAGVPMESRFGGLLQIRKNKPFRFVELIHYAGCSLDPSEMFIKAKMTSVSKVVSEGNGRILANFREIPVACRDLVNEIITRLKGAGLGGVLLMGETSEPVCEVSLELNRIGMVLIGGLNPVAAVEEAGIEVDNHANSILIDYRSLKKFTEIEK